jgi:coenzyme PQQ precursor peptide PqqA
MNGSYRPALDSAMLRLVNTGLQSIRRKRMRWETPQAVDLRFGMEITMYIANR